MQNNNRRPTVSQFVVSDVSVCYGLGAAKEGVSERPAWAYSSIICWTHVRRARPDEQPSFPPETALFVV